MKDLSGFFPPLFLLWSESNRAVLWRAGFQGGWWAAGGFLSVLWSSIILHYIFCQIQVGSFETFLADLWTQNVTGEFWVFIWGQGMTLPALSMNPLKKLWKHVRLLRGQYLKTTPEVTVNHWQMNSCVLYTMWLCGWRQKSIYFQHFPGEWDASSGISVNHLEHVFFPPHLTHTLVGKTQGKSMKFFFVGIFNTTWIC